MEKLKSKLIDSLPMPQRKQHANGKGLRNIRSWTTSKVSVEQNYSLFRISLILISVFHERLLKLLFTVYSTKYGL
jgi:hypothetical protein